MDFSQFWHSEVFRHPVSRWAEALAYAVAISLGLRIVRAILTSRLSALARKTATLLDDLILRVVASTRLLAMVLIGIGIGAGRLDFGKRYDAVVQKAIGLAVLLQVGFWLSAVISFCVENYGERDQRTGATSTVVKAIGVFAKLVLWSAVLLFALDNVGVRVTALVAGLGVGGIAVALALQNILGDLFASLSIVLDKPFVIGDSIAVGEYLGSVEHIGLKTVRVRSLSGEQIIFSNNDLLSSRVRNYGRMERRRVAFTIGVSGQTPREKLARIPLMIREAVTEQEGVEFDRSHFKAMGAAAMDFETVYFVLSPDYQLYMDIQQAINLRIHELFEQEDIKLAYPAQTLFVTPIAPS